MSRELKGALIALALAVAYMGARSWINHAYPAIQTVPTHLEDRGMGRSELVTEHEEFSIHLWFRQDALKSIPRLLLFVLSLWATWRLIGLREAGWHTGATARNGALGIAAWLSVVSVYFLLREPAEFTAQERLLGWLTTLPVAFGEEACFRGLLFAGLRRQIGALAAGVASAAVFMIWHYGAQPFDSFPSIFCFGLLACAAVYRGLGLPWLVLIHELADVPDFYVNSRVPSFADPAGKVYFSYLAAVTLWAGWELSRAQREPS